MGVRHEQHIEESPDPCRVLLAVQMAVPLAGRVMVTVSMIMISRLAVFIVRILRCHGSTAPGRALVMARPVLDGVFSLE